ncbi:MAG: FliM/FliN family flagellar motor switch protein [Bryobacterales bacterium]|nr:FliM/FliN family flagellar motor switch protein [Bryobacteraceae bacterium]MDW8130129.1 FliM/FliN family flagellar motor switch protein [Bryobacterales bacterium]
MAPLEEIAFFADVPVELELVLDRMTMTVREILELEEGSLLRLTRSAGDNIDVYASDALLAYGEVVVIESAIGVRLTDFPHEQ